MSLSEADREFIRTADRQALLEALRAASAAHDYEYAGELAREVLRRPKFTPTTPA